MISYNPIGPSSERLSEDYLALNSCGVEHLFNTDRGSIRKNGRIDYHILYIERGICYLELEGKEIQAGAGNIILFRPGEPQCYNFLASDRSVNHYIHFTGVGCEELLERLGIGDIRVFDMGTSDTYEAISAKMVREYTLKRDCWETWATGCLYELLSLIARKYALRAEHISHENESRISMACRLIYDNIASPPSISALAKKCHLSVGRFSHLFTEVAGKSPNEYVISLRIGRARELLENTQLSIREIAESTGFSDQNYFSRIFKERTGVSPREFRKQLTENLLNPDNHERRLI